MFLILLLFTLPVAGAVVLTYVYDRNAQIWWRLAEGAFVGSVILGLAGFVFASLIGMTSIALILSSLVAAAPLYLLIRSGDLRRRILADCQEGVDTVRRALVEPDGGGRVILFYVCATTALWYLCARVMYANVAGVFTGLDTNIGDLPFHLGVITNFSWGHNFPPQHPEFAGARLAYPFVADFVTSMFVRAGMSLPGAFFWQNLILLLALIALLHRWSLLLLGDRTAALLTPVIALLSGGLGWWQFLKEAAQNGGVFAWLGHLPHDYTIMAGGYRWGNALTALFLTQRGIVLGVGLATIVFTLWLQAAPQGEPTTELAAEQSGSGPDQNQDVEVKSAYGFLAVPFAWRPMIAAGIVAGLLPLVHAHSFVVTVGMGACLTLVQVLYFLFGSRSSAAAPAGGRFQWFALRPILFPWLLFLGIAVALGTPQALWALRGSSMQGGNFIGWQTGWDHGTENVVWFWIKNTAVFFPLLVAGLFYLWAGKKGRVLFFSLPFALCFIGPNLVRLAPWVWDNNKVLIFWWLAFAPLVAVVLVQLWRASIAWRFVAVLMLLLQTAAGGLDVWRAASGAVERQVYDAHELEFADVIKRETPPEAVILHAPTYNDPVYLTGRRSFMGYPGHLWSHGIAYSEREAELKEIFTAQNDATSLIEKHGIEFVVIGPLEAAAMRERGAQVNKSFFERYHKVGQVREYELYKTTPAQKQETTASTSGNN